jgi:hypothetical protein
MTNAGALPAALGYLSSWWQKAVDPAAFDTLLAGWVRVCGWCAAGFIWPAEGGPEVVRVAPAGYEYDSVLAAELPEVLRQVRAGEPAVFVPNAQTAGRVPSSVQLSGRCRRRASGKWPRGPE